MNILVTGASGFIGSHITKRLEEEGHHLTLVDNFVRGNPSYFPYLGIKTKCHNGDLLDYRTAITFTKNIDTVFHTAARIGSEQFLHGSPKSEIETLQTNFTIDGNIFRACIENKVKKVIYPSSISVYNITRQLEDEAIFKEEDFEKDRFNPEGGYGWAKVIAEKQLLWMNQLGIDYGVARIFKAFGPCNDMSIQSGEVVSSLFTKALNNDKLVLWGDGEATRCLLYVDDLVDGLVKLSQYDGSLTANIGAIKPIKIKDLAKLILKTIGRDIPIEFDMTKQTKGPISRIPNITLAKEKLNWQPTTSIEEGLQKIYDWMKQEMVNQ